MGLFEDIFNVVAPLSGIGQAVGLIEGAEKNRTDAEKRASMPKYLTQDLSQNNALPWQKYISSDLTGTNETGGGLANDTLNRLNDPKAVKDTQFRNVNFSNFQAPKRDSLGDPISAALNRKYATQYDTKIGGLQNEANIKDPIYRSKQYDRAGKIFGNVWQNQVANFKEQVAFQQQRQQMWQQWRNAQDQAKSSFISSVLGLGGMAAGFALGGPPGAAIGGVAGDFTGKSVANIA